MFPGPSKEHWSIQLQQRTDCGRAGQGLHRTGHQPGLEKSLDILHIKILSCRKMRIRSKLP